DVDDTGPERARRARLEPAVEEDVAREGRPVVGGEVQRSGADLVEIASAGDGAGEDRVVGGPLGEGVRAELQRRAGHAGQVADRLVAAARYVEGRPRGREVDAR